MNDKLKPVNQLLQIYSLMEVNEQNPFDIHFDDSIFDLVDEFLGVYESTDYIQLILECSLDENIHKVGCLFSILLWSTRDEGEKVQNWRVQSFEHENQRDIEIALCVTDVYPMKDLVQFSGKLKEIAAKFPETKPLCDYWIDQVQKELIWREVKTNDGPVQKIMDKIAGLFKI